MTIKENIAINVRDHKSEIIKYVKSLPISSKYKDEIIAAEFIDVVLPIYTKYPSLFSTAFSVKEDIRLLNIAGFLYHRSIIYLDKLLDNQSQKSDSILLVTICQEESIKILATIYPLESEFWQLWNARRREYLAAYYIDKVSHKINSYTEYEELADFKSAFGKISIDCMYLLSSDKNERLYETLLQSHKYYYCALQILDDINDLREDSEKDQFNIALYELKTELEIRGLTIETSTIENISKYLYVFGIAEKLFDKGLYYLESAKECIVSFEGLSEWLSEIDRLMNLVITKKLNVQAFLKMSIVQLNLSHNQAPAKNLTDSVFGATDFILKTQNANGSFNEYFNEAGMSDVWATSFIISYLGQKNVRLGEVFENTKNKAVNFLINSSNNGLWGYNKEWIPDSDSSTFAQLAIYLITGDISNSKLESWLKYQNADGSFSTYNNPDHVLSSLNRIAERDSVSGWLAPHACVSASAFYFLTQVNDKSENLRLLKDYLKSTMNEGKVWSAYWWSSPIYTTSFMIKSYSNVTDQELKQMINKSVESIVKSQNKNGSFGDKNNKDSVFYTALVIDSICDNPDMFIKAKKQINNAVEWLLSTQMSDGSWLSTHALRIPAPNILDPSKLELWPVDTKGVNIRPKEFSRLFTTSVSLSALSKFDYVNKL
ncbi:MAG: hypothetical protein ORN54_08385 [Cyclobacteriaceae bacterium]|nr:hypothetical protein [Cyclobacteriaceae bacterium]